MGLAGPAGLLLGVMAFYYVSLSRFIDARLHGERTRTFPRIFARPFELAAGQSLTNRQLIDRLNDLGYAQVAKVESPGEFAVGQNAVALVIRGGKADGDVIRVVFGPAAAKPNSPATSTIKRVEHAGGRSLGSVTLEPPLLTALIPEAREKRRNVPLAQIPARVRQAVLAIEDRRFYDHPGVDPIR